MVFFQHKEITCPKDSTVLLSETTVSPVEGKLMEADRLKMCGMMWLKEHETCSLMSASHVATGETERQLNECFYINMFSLPKLVVWELLGTMAWCADLPKRLCICSIQAWMRKFISEKRKIFFPAHIRDFVALIFYKIVQTWAFKKHYRNFFQ